MRAGESAGIIGIKAVEKYKEITYNNTNKILSNKKLMNKLMKLNI